MQRVTRRVVDARSHLYGSGFSSLPVDEEHPNLVKVFIDAQYDYLRGSLTMRSLLLLSHNQPSNQHWTTPTYVNSSNSNTTMRSQALQSLLPR